MKRAMFLALVVACPVFAQDLAPETSPKPQPKQSSPISPQVAPAATPPAEDAEPENAAETDDSVALVGVRDLLRETDADYAACLAQLDAMGVTYTEAEPLIPEDDADCGILRPLMVSEISAGVVISPSAMLRCETATALALWTKDFVLPASERLSDRGALTAIENGSGYVCRRRNNLPTGKLSEHAFGNAFDVMAFRFEDGSRLAIEPRETEGSMAEAFQDAVRGAACMDFSTVLGPGSNAAHADHLHLDIIARTSGYRLCEQSGADPD
ncbi:extensin-like domain-containing protein [Sulfitobacter sp.]|uniref:extensin-like domain-containing protein n=1 Tax=Sulfitobacter sp. TaxID=1903071 RepID=UPI003F6AAEA7